MSGSQFLTRAVILFTILAGLGLGCGKNDSTPETVPVSGKVTVDNQPVAEGQVSFVPFDKEQKTGAACTGRIDSTGGYVMYTGDKNGVPPGRYKVTVTPVMVPTGNNKMPTVPFDKKYSDSKNTPIIVTVPGGDYDLKLSK
jgi:hypothetical protein